MRRLRSEIHFPVARARKQNPDPLSLVLAALASGDTAEGVRETLASLHPADIARLLKGMPPEQRPAVCQQVDPEVMGEVLRELPRAIRVDLVMLTDDQTMW